VAVAPDGRTVVAGRVEDGKACIDVLDLPSGRRTASWPAAGKQIDHLAFSPDARSLFVLERQGGVLSQNSVFGRAWDPGAGRPTTPPMTGTTTGFFTPAADRLVTATSSLWLVREAASGRVRGSGLHAGAIKEVASHPDGCTVISSTYDSLHLWQISPDAELVPDGGTGTQTSTTGMEPDRRTRDVILFSAGLGMDGQMAISASTGAGGRELIRFSDAATGRPLGRPAAHYPGWNVRGFALSPDGRCFATASHPVLATGDVRIWDAGTGRLRCPPMPQINHVAALAFQPDGKVLAAGDYGGQVRLWDALTGREIGRPLAQSDIVSSLAYSPDGQVLAVGLAKDNSGRAGVRLWDTRTRQPIGELLPSTSGVQRIAFRPDGRALLADTSGNAIYLWDVPRGQAIGEPMIDEASGGFRPDGRAFLTAGSDGSVKLRDAATGAVLTSLLTGTSPATCAAFRGDGGLVVAGFADGTVRLCDPATSLPVGPPRSMRHAVHHVAFTPDGRTVAAIDDLGESRTWPVPEPLPDESLDDLTLRIEARTGLRMETGLVISPLDAPAWRDRLERLGRLDPAAVRPDDVPAWHEPMIGEAERNGHAFAALWHLDHLVAARPDDWYLHARRARAWSLSDGSDRFDRAAADYQQAERLGSREQVLDFQAHCVVDCTEAGRWAEALWYLDRLIAARPDDGALHEDRAAVYGQLGREADRQAELARAFELGADQGLVIPRAEELGRAGRWAEAAGLLARCGRTGPLSRELAQPWVIACLKAGDRAGYREACAAFLAREGPDPTVVWNEVSAASFFALGAEGLDDYRLATGWLERRLSAVPAPRPLLRHIFAGALGGLLLRAGRVDEAIIRLREGITAGEAEIPTDWAYLAMAHAKKGDLVEARRSLDRLRASRPDPQASFWDLQELELLRGEAESLLLDAGFPRDPFPGRRPR
jgi:WD40 repeat protein/Flp pilus assembly protein TadD